MFLSISLEVIEVRVIVKKCISEHCCVLNSKLHGWSDSDGVWSTLESVYSSLEKVPLNTVASLRALAVESKMGSVTSDVKNISGFSSDSLQLDFQKAADIFLDVEKTFAFDHFPDSAIVKELHHI
mgnify:FL=1